MSNITQLRVNSGDRLDVKRFSLKLSQIYGKGQFNSQYPDIAIGKLNALEVWTDVLGGYTNGEGVLVIKSLVGSGSLYLNFVPTLPQLAGLFRDVKNKLKDIMEGSETIVRYEPTSQMKEQDKKDDKAIIKRFGESVLAELKKLKGREYCFRRLDLLSQINPRLIPFVKILKKNDDVEKTA